MTNFADNNNIMKEVSALSVPEIMQRMVDNDTFALFIVNSYRNIMRSILPGTDQEDKVKITAIIDMRIASFMEKMINSDSFGIHVIETVQKTVKRHILRTR